MAGRDPGRPAFDLWSLDLDGPPAVPAYQVVVVVLGIAAAVASLAVVTSEGVDVTGVGQEPVVDSREPDVLAPGAQLGEELLGGAEPVGGFQNGGQARASGGSSAPGALVAAERGAPAAALSGTTIARLVVVPVAGVGGVAVPVVHIVDVVVMGNGHVSATLAVRVVVSGVLAVDVGGALVDVALMHGVDVAVVGVVRVVAVSEGEMPAVLTVHVVVIGMLGMRAGHGCTSWECRMASLTMWPTWASESW